MFLILSLSASSYGAAEPEATPGASSSSEAATAQTHVDALLAELDTMRAKFHGWATSPAVTAKMGALTPFMFRGWERARRDVRRLTVPMRAHAASLPLHQRKEGATIRGAQSPILAARFKAFARIAQAHIDAIRTRGEEIYNPGRFAGVLAEFGGRETLSVHEIMTAVLRITTALSPVSLENEAMGKFTPEEKSLPWSKYTGDHLHGFKSSRPADFSSPQELASEFLDKLVGSALDPIPLPLPGQGFLGTGTLGILVTSGVGAIPLSCEVCKVHGLEMASTTSVEHDAYHLLASFLTNPRPALRQATIRYIAQHHPGKDVLALPPETFDEAVLHVLRNYVEYVRFMIGVFRAALENDDRPQATRDLNAFFLMVHELVGVTPRLENEGGSVAMLAEYLTEIRETNIEKETLGNPDSPLLAVLEDRLAAEPGFGAFETGGARSDTTDLSFLDEAVQAHLRQKYGAPAGAYTGTRIQKVFNTGSTWQIELVVPYTGSEPVAGVLHVVLVTRKYREGDRRDAIKTLRLFGPEYAAFAGNPYGPLSEELNAFADRLLALHFPGGGGGGGAAGQLAAAAGNEDEALAPQAGGGGGAAAASAGGTL